MRYLSNTLRFITALAGCLVIFCLVTMKWLTATFGKNINIDQILFHLIAPTTGVSSNIVISALLFFLVFAAGGGMGFYCLPNRLFHSDAGFITRYFYKVA